MHLIFTLNIIYMISVFNLGNMEMYVYSSFLKYQSEAILFEVMKILALHILNIVLYTFKV